MMNGSVLAIRPVGRELIRLQVRGDRFAQPDNESGRGIDLSRFSALPGLADCHAHLAADSLGEVDRPGDLASIRSRSFAQLAAGVFLVIDKGWRDEVVLELLDDPPQTRPDLEAAAGIITGPHGYFPGFAVETDEAGLTAAVRSANKAGGWVKIIGDWPQRGRGPVINFGEAALASAVRVAHEAGARVAIHAMAPETPTLAVRSGVDSIEHGLYLRPEDVEMLGARMGAWVPTIGNTLDVIETLGPGSSGARILGRGLENVAELLQVAAEIGVAVLAGTDLGLKHGEIAKEAALLHKYGLSGAAAVEAAGTAAYHYLGRDQLVPEASADLLLFETDPTCDITELMRPVAGMRAGRILFDRRGLLSIPGS